MNFLIRLGSALLKIFLKSGNILQAAAFLLQPNLLLNFFYLINQPFFTLQLEKCPMKNSFSSKLLS